MPMRRHLILALPFLVLACDNSKTVIPDSGKADTQDSSATTTTGSSDTGGAGSGSGSGGSGSGSGSGGTGATVRDVDEDGYSPDDLLDCNDNDPSVNAGAAEILGDGIDQDCDGIADDISFDEVSGLISCTDARSPRITSNTTHTFVSVLCSEATYVPEGESDADSYWDSALAFGWSHAHPQGPPAGFYDWLRNASDPPTPLLSGQGLMASDTALYGAVATSTETHTVFRIGGYDLEADGRFSVTFNGSLATNAFDQIEVMLDPFGNVHAVACDDGAGPPRYLGGTTEGIRDSDYQFSESIGALGSPSTCGLHFATSGVGTFVGRDTGDYLWATFDPTTLPPSSVSSGSIRAATPKLMRVVTGPAGNVANGAYVVFQNESNDHITIQDATSSPDTSAIYTWDLPDPETLSASMSADGSVVAVAILDRDGTPTVAIGAPSGTPTTYTPTFPTGVSTIDELEVQLDPSGKTVWLAATNERALYVGAFALP
jgi:hypothetical protein